jgi:hypothetical protein
MTKRLTTQNATITTAAVEMKTLTISGKQVTLAVFRQLREEPLIAEDGTLNGVPWGIVNYCPNKCADDVEHWHVVWQRGSELLRAQTDVEPPSQTLRVKSRYAEMWVREWLHGRIDDCPLVQYRDYCFFRRQDIAVSTGRIGQTAQDAIRGRRWYDQEPNNSHARSQMERSRAELDKELAGVNYTLDDMQAELDRQLIAEKARRERWAKQLTALAELPQLFIAV